MFFGEFSEDIITVPGNAAPQFPNSTIMGKILQTSAKN